MTEQRVSDDELNKWLGTFGPSGPSAKPTFASNFALDLRDARREIAWLRSRYDDILRVAENQNDIIHAIEETIHNGI